MRPATMLSACALLLAAVMGVNGDCNCGGSREGTNEYPMFFGITLRRPLSLFCSGVLVTPYHGLATAHCTAPVKGLLMAGVFGDHDIANNPHKKTELVDIAYVKEHEQYDEKTKLNDIAVVVFERKVPMGDLAGLACLPKVRANLAGKPAKVLGWNGINRNTPVPRQTDVKFLDIGACASAYRDVHFQSRAQTCTTGGNPQICQFNFGNPVMWRDNSGKWNAIGLFSYDRGCQSGDPTVYTDLAAYLPWIKQKIEFSRPQGEICHA